LTDVSYQNLSKGQALTNQERAQFKILELSLSQFTVLIDFRYTRVDVKTSC